MASRLVVLWALVAIPFVGAAVTGGPDGLLPHIAFHVVYLAFLAAAVVVALQVRSLSSGSRFVRGFALALAVTQTMAIIGQTGEGIRVMQHGGLAAGPGVFEDWLHLAAAYGFTFPGLMLSWLALFGLTIASIGAARTARRVVPAVV